MIMLAFTFIILAEPVKIEFRQPEISEISGIEMLECCDSLVFAVNDSGNPSEVYVLNMRGEIAQTIVMPQGYKNNDWEDITSMQTGHNGVLFIADIGNNKLLKTSYQIILMFFTFRCNESIPVQIDSLKTLNFTMENNSYDAETLIYDSISGNLYVITKWGEFSKVFEITNPLTRSSKVFPAKYCGKLPLSIITGGDLNAEGDKLLLKTYIEVCFWYRLPNESFGDMCSRAPDALMPYKTEPQGEAICWSPDSRFYYTMSERKNNATVFLYKYAFNMD